jgi:Terminase large subunit, T4likevirus-type, N-terminal
VSKKPLILWQPNSDVQRAFLACSALTAMIGGGAGSGKTSGLLAAAATQSGNPKHRAVIFRRDFPSLRHIISASYPLFLPLRASYNKSEHCWTFPSGSTLEFSHLEDETAMYQHAGKEYSFCGFDELTQLPGDAVDSRGQPINSAFSFMQSRLRAPNDSGLRLEIRCTATPGGPGMAWVKDYFRIPDSGESTEFVDSVTGFRRAYFKATVKDNPALSGTDYERQLLDLPAAQRKALLLGDWSSYVGQVFSEWDYQKHTCEKFEVPESFEMWRACDDGFACPACVLWFGFDKVSDRIFVVDELYERGLAPEDLARAVLWKDYKFSRQLSGVIDSSAFAEIGLGAEGGKGSRGDVMNAAGCGWSPSEKGAGSRIQGISVIHQRLKLRSDGYGGLVIFRSCRNLIRCLPAQVYSTRNPEDIDDSCEQHCIDALRYGLTRKKRIFVEERVQGL